MKKLVAACAAALSLACHADTMVDWVVDNSHTGISKERAGQYVAAAKKYAAKHHVDPILVLAVIRKETGFRITAVSKEGAEGPMQVMPQWHREKIKGKNIKSIEGGVDIGTQVLAEYIVLAKGDVKAALRKYSGGSRTYAQQVLNYRADLVMATRDAGRHTIAMNTPYVSKQEQ